MINTQQLQINEIIQKKKKKNYLTIYLYGAIIILEGIFLLFSNDILQETVNITTGNLLIVGAILAFISAYERQRKQVQLAYHEMHALAMLVYGISILMFSTTLEQFISFTVFLFFYYSFSEIIFCFWLFNLGKKPVNKIVFIRFLLGIAIGIGTIFSINYSEFALMGFGILFIIVGVNIVLYIPVLREKEIKVASSEVIADQTGI